MSKQRYSSHVGIVLTAGLLLTGCNPDTGSTPSLKPQPDTILRHSTSLYSSIAFFVGTQLDIFTTLDANPMTAQEVAEAMDIKPHLMERLLYALAAAELLENDRGKFSNTTESSRFLVKGKSDYLGDHVLVNPLLKHWMFAGGLTTADTLRNGASAQSFDYSDTDFDMLLETFKGTMPVAVKAGQELAKRFDFSGFESLVDVGGASGGLAVSLHNANPHLDITVTDLSSVTPVARALLQEQGASGIDVLEWDVLAGPCERTFDVAVLRALIQVLPSEKAAEAIKNIASSVNPGGQVVLMGHIMDNTRTSPVEEVVWYLLNLNWDDHAGYYTEEDIRGMFRDAGLRDIQRTYLPNGDCVMWAIKPAS